MDARTAIFHRPHVKLTIHWWNLLSILAVGSVYGPLVWGIWKTSIERAPTQIQNEATDLVREVDQLYLRSTQLPRSRVEAGRDVEMGFRRARISGDPLTIPAVP